MTIGIIGGSGMYDPKMLRDPEDIGIDTPFGHADMTVGYIGEKKIAFISRHGYLHQISPSEVNSRANIFALKKVGVSRIIAVSTVGSLKEEIRPLDIVIPDQIFDRTMRRSTFFEDGIVAHISFADPFCPELSELILNVAVEKGHTVHSGTYVCIEGLQFSTRAESFSYRKMGFDVIGMTALPEAKLAREAEICYSMISTVTDYDVWKDEEVDVGTIISNMKKNESAVRQIIMDVVPKISDSDDSDRRCICQRALDGAIVSHSVSDEVKRRLNLLIGRYIE
jgi:5'-methylthioadenosine phosphorylase